MASIDVGIHPDPSGITSRRFGQGATASFSTLDIAVKQTLVSVFIERPVLDALQAALDEIRADMDAAAQTASDQVPTVMADWPAGPPGEALAVFGK